MTSKKAAPLRANTATALLERAREDPMTFERLIQLVYSNLLTTGDTVVDGGAHTGLHTFPLSRLIGPAGNVIAVEALPDLANDLRRRTISLANVTVVAAALTDFRGRVTFQRVHEDLARSGIQRVPYPGPMTVQQVVVPALQLDDLVSGSLRFIKLDLEGGEFNALRGGRQSIKRFNPLIIFERSIQTAAAYGYTATDYFALLADIGYLTFDLFGVPITESGWARFGRPWYAIAVKRGSVDEAWVREHLPNLLASFARSTLGQSPD